MSARRPMARPPEVPRPFTTPTTPVFARPRCTSMPQLASLSATSAEVRVSSKPSSGCACRSCRIASSSEWYSRMRSTGLPMPPLESGRARFRKPSRRLAAPSRAQRASLAGHAGPIPHLALGSDAAANAGGSGHSLLPALRVPLSRRAGARSRGRGRGAAALERPRLLCPRAQPASGRSKARLRARRQIPGFGRRDRAGSRHRALERRGDRGVRLRRPRCVARRENRVRELPAPRPRRTVPLRHATWLLLVHNQQVLLERRPGAGLWGGLWTFPVASNAGYAAQARELGCEISSTRELEPLEHGFTHFRLRIRPVLCGVARTLPGAAAPGRLWIDLEAAAQAAAPAPVKKLIARLGASNASW